MACGNHAAAETDPPTPYHGASSGRFAVQRRKREAGTVCYVNVPEVRFP
jgi:hypothetical protein